MTKEEFATKIKAKYPEYQAVDTNTLVSKIVEKYPVYQGQISDYTVAPKSNVFTRVGDELSKRSENIAETVNTVGTDTPVLKTSLDVANQVVGAPIAAAYEALPQGVQNVGDKVGAAFGNTISSITDYISDIPKLQKFIMENPDKAKQLEDVFGAVASGSELVGNATALVGAPGAVQRTVNTTRNAANTVAGATRNAVNQTFQAGKKVLPKSENIMNKVARLTPTQARKFEQLTGKTHGQYLKDTGNFGTPDEIVRRESEKFAQSLKSVDDTLSQLDGNFTDGVIDDVLNELQEKAVATSTKNVKSPYLDRVNELMAKNTESGLSMSEINELKRLYERNVKLGYNKLVDAEKIQRATNLDNALREWQISKAEELGFENLRDLNKQTQASKQLINSLGDQLIGKTGLNDVTLTDWIMLSGGDPTAVGGLLTKKFFSSKKVQSKIAEWLNDTEVTPIIKPKVGGNYIDQASTATTTTNTTKNNISSMVPETTPPVKRPAKNMFSGSSPGFANIGGEMKDVTRYVDKTNPYSKAASFLDETDRAPIEEFRNAVKNKLPISRKLTDDVDNIIEAINNSVGKQLINPYATDLSKMKQLSLLKEADDALTTKAISAYDKAQAKLGAKTNTPVATDLTSEAKKYKSAEELTNLNPTGGLNVDYTPEKRMQMKIGNNITTLSETMKKSPDSMITIYRGAPKSQKSINPGDFITTDMDIAKSYTGDGNVLSKRVRAGDILDDIEEPLGGEYLYRPGASAELSGRKYDYTKSEWFTNYTDYLVKNKDKFSSVDEWVTKMKASGKTKSQLTEIWNKANKKK